MISPYLVRNALLTLILVLALVKWVSWNFSGAKTEAWVAA
jgi:hypothetical protein